MDQSGCCYDIAGLKICLRNTPKLLERAIDKAFSLSRSMADAPHLYLKGSIQEDNVFIEAMPSLVRERYEQMESGGDPVIFRGPNDQLALLAKGKRSSTYAYSLPPFNQVDLFCQRLTDRTTPLLFQSVLIPVISELLLRKGKLLMHAGCVATPEGEGILLLADGGGGKTTTVYAMVREGFHFLSDDLVVASIRDKDFILEPVREKINIAKKTIEFFPDLRFLQQSLKQSKEKKLPVDPEVIIDAGRLTDSARAAAILIVNLYAQGPELLARDASSMLKVLLKSNTFARRDHISKPGIEKIWGLLEQTVSYQLDTGFDPEALGQWLAQMAANGKFGKASQTLAKENLIGKEKNKEIVHIKNKDNQISGRQYHAVLQAVLEHSLEGKGTASTLLNQLSFQAGIQNFYSWLKYHRVELHFAKYMAALGCGRSAALAIDFKSQLSRAKAFFILIQTAAKKVFQHLDAAAIPALMLRGPALAIGYYPEPFMRYCRDIDVIVKPESLRDAENILASLGFCLKGSRVYWQRRGEWPYTDGQVTIELHLEAYPVDVAASFHTTNFWAQSDVIDLNGYPVRGLNPNHLLVSSCLHLSCEHRLDRLIRVIDIRQIVNRAKDIIDWDWVVHQAIVGSQRFAVWQALRCATEIANTQVPATVLRQLAPLQFSEKMAAKIFPPYALLATPSNSSRVRRFVFFRILKNRAK